MKIFLGYVLAIGPLYLIAFTAGYLAGEANGLISGIKIGVGVFTLIFLLFIMRDVGARMIEEARRKK